MNALHYLQFTFNPKATDAIVELSLELRLFNLFFIAFFSFFLLRYPIHKHQVLSFILVGISCILFLIMDLIIILILCINFVFSIREVVHKYLMEVLLMSSVWIVFIERVFGIIFTLILQLYMRYDLYNPLISIFTDWDIGKYFLLYFFSCLFYDFVAIITKYYYEPTVMPASYSFSVIAWKIALACLNSVFDSGNYIFIIGSVLSLFACFIYNEIVILYFCDLERNTKTEIIKRSDDECNAGELQLALLFDLDNEENDLDNLSE